jgi:hypothetical protein
VQNILYHGVWQYHPIVHFYVDESGATLQDSNAGLLTSPPSVPTSAQNVEAIWNPTPITCSELLLVETQSDDLTHQTDVHLYGTGVLTPLTGSGSASRLLDVGIGVSDTVHVLWRTKVSTSPTVMHGVLDLESGTLISTTAVVTGYRNPAAGRVVVLAGQPHVFWLETRSHSSDPLPGVYYATKTGGAWSAPVRLISSEVEWLHEEHDWEKHNTLRYMFDAVQVGDQILLVAAWRGTSQNESTMQYRVLDGAWSTASVIEVGNIRGIDLVGDAAGRAHLVYWVGTFSQRRGSLHSRIFDGGSWSGPQLVDSGGAVGYPSLAAGESQVAAVYERQVGDQVVPVLAVRSGETWQELAQMQVPAGHDAWYPMVRVAAGKATVVWSQRSPDEVTAGREDLLLQRLHVPLALSTPD